MSISRLQLAAALLGELTQVTASLALISVEYDNDADHPTSPPVSHRKSALFTPFQPKPLDHVPLPSQRHSYRPTSHYSTHAPPPHAHTAQRDEEETEQDVDVQRWDIPEHLLSPQSSASMPRPLPTRPHTFSGDVLPRHELPPLQVVSASPRPQPISSPLSDRVTSVHLDVMDGINRSSSSVGYWEPMGDRDEHLSSADMALAHSARVREMAEGSRPISVLSLDVEPRTRKMSNPIMVPLPPSPASTLNQFSSRPFSSMSHRTVPRRNSMLGFNEEYEEQETLEDQGPNPFALPAPPAEIGSRFDPKILDAQRRSIDSDAARPRPTSYMSLIDLDTRQRQQSFGSSRRMSMQMPEQNTPASPQHELTFYPEIPTAAEYGKPLRPNKYGPVGHVDRRSLLRPKTLIMPTPLIGAHQPMSPSKHKVPEGYTVGDKPLPPGSRSSILSMGNGRPGLPLSLSQKTFRSSLLVGGKREDEEYWVGGAEEDGEQAVQDGGDEGEPLGPTDRRPGKLYGKSLMDQLEARKAALKGKQRTFAGDSRPAMMARGSERQDTSHPTSATDPHHDTGPHPHRQPLLTFDSSGDVDVNKRLSPPANNRIAHSKSVFGVDQVWEKEMAKLKIIQEREKRETEERDAREALKKKSKKKDKGKGKATALGPFEQHLSDNELEVPVSAHPAGPASSFGVSPVKPTSSLPPRLAYSPEKSKIPNLPVLTHDMPRQRAESRAGLGNWSDSDDEDDGPKIRVLNKGKGRAVESDDSDSEEDVPLSKLAKSSANAKAAPAASDDESDEDVPLSRLKPVSPQAAKVAARSPVLNIDTQGLGSGSLGLDIPAADSPIANGPSISKSPINNAIDDDDVPLMLRQTPRPANDAEDDLPLAFKHANTHASRQAADAYRQSMFTPQFPAMPYHSPSWYGQPPMMGQSPYMAGYGFPSMPNMNMNMNMGLGYPVQGMMAPPMPMQHQGMDMGMHMGMGMMPPPPAGGDWGPPPEAKKNIDSWRKEVAIAPTPTGSG